MESWVFDTNVVLDWLLFEDPCCVALARAVTSGRARWIASESMRSELVHVLGRDIGKGRGRPAAVVLDDWQRWATIVEPSDQPSPRALRCSDTDDQKFIDLAWQVRASTLVSRDRAVLKLALRAALHGFAIVSMSAWAARLETPATDTIDTSPPRPHL